MGLKLLNMESSNRCEGYKKLTRDRCKSKQIPFIYLSQLTCSTSTATLDATATPFTFSLSVQVFILSYGTIIKIYIQNTKVTGDKTAASKSQYLQWHWMRSFFLPSLQLLLSLSLISFFFLLTLKSSLELAVTSITVFVVVVVRFASRPVGNARGRE